MDNIYVRDFKLFADFCCISGNKIKYTIFSLYSITLKIIHIMKVILHQRNWKYYFC